jgi:hypothetical protein
VPTTPYSPGGGTTAPRVLTFPQQTGAPQELTNAYRTTPLKEAEGGVGCRSVEATPVPRGPLLVQGVTPLKEAVVAAFRKHDSHGTGALRMPQLKAAMADAGENGSPTVYCDEKVANREIRVWHFVIENGY